jgi:hypothetical protein
VCLVVGCCSPACSNSPDAEPVPRVLECEWRVAIDTVGASRRWSRIFRVRRCEMTVAAVRRTTAEICNLRLSR